MAKTASGRTVQSRDEWKKSLSSGSGTAASNNSTSAVTSSGRKVQSRSEWRASASQRGEYTQGGRKQDPFGSFLTEANKFFQGAEKEINNSKGFDAAEFFESRKRQGDVLKNWAADLSSFIDNHADSYTPEYYDYTKSILASFDTDVDDVLSYYQPSVNAKAGMRAYEDEYLAYQEKQKNSQLPLAIQAGMMPEITNPAYGFINMQNQYRADNSHLQVSDQWTDDEKFQLGLLQQEDPAEAREFARKVNDYHNAKSTEAQRKGIRDAATQNFGAGALHTVGALGTSTLMGMPEFLDRMAEYTARGTTTEKAGMMPSDYSAEVTGGISQHLNDKYGTIGEGVPVLGGKGVGDLYNMGYSIGQNLLSRYTLGAVGGQPLVLASYFANAANSGIDEARRRGASGDQAIKKGLITGALEVATEFIPTSKLFKMGPAVTVGQLLKEVGVESLEEFVGEGLNAAGGYVADMLIMDDMSEYETSKRNYMEQGMTEEEAHAQTLKDAVNDIIYEGLSGVVSGALSAGTETAYKTGKANQYYRNIDTQALIDEAMDTSVEGKAYQMAEGMQKKVDAGEKISGNDKRMLAYNTELMQLAEEKVNAEAAARDDLMMLGQVENLEQLAEIVAKRRRGEKLTRSDRKAIRGNENVQQLFETMDSNDSEEEMPTVSTQSVEAEAPQMQVAEDGRARQISTNTSVDLQDFASIENGKATIRLKDGGTADMDDIAFANDTETRQFATVASLPGIEAEAANAVLAAMVQNETGNTVESSSAIRDAYQLGLEGYQMSDMNAEDAAHIPLAMQAAAFEAGRTQRAITATAIPTVSKKATTKPTGDYKKVVIEGKGINLNKKQQAEVSFMDFVADNFSGTTVHVYASYKGLDGKFYYRDSNGQKQSAPNGRYVGDEIWVDLNSGARGEGLVLNTFGHEMYHHIEKWSKPKANELAEFLIKELGKDSVDSAIKEQIEKATRAGYGVEYFKSKGMTQDQAENMVRDRAMSDFVADSLETMFTSGNPAESIAKLKSENRSLFDKIKAFVDDFVSKLRKFYKDKTISKEGEWVAQLESFEKIQQMFMEAMADAGENYRAAEVTNEKSTTPEDDAKFSERSEDRITMSMTDSERTEILKDKVITAEAYEGQADQAIADKKGDLNSYRENLIKAALVKIGEEFKVFTDYSIADVKTDFRLSRGNIKESVSKEIDPINLAKLMPVFKTAVENAIGIERHANRYFFDNDTVSFENLLGGYVDGDKFIPIRFGLKHSKKGGATLYLIVDQNAIDINKIKAEVTKVPSAHDVPTDTSRPAFKISLPSVIPFVNSKDLLRYVPDDMLTDNQKKLKWEAIAETIVYTNNKNDKKYADFIEKGNLDAASRMVEQAAKTAGYTNLFYHGAKKGGGFTRFREWSYFTENRGYAERYAQRGSPDSLYEVFAKMEKPFDTRDAETRAIFEDIRSEYGLSEIQDSGLPDWTDGYDISDYIGENGMDYDSIVLDEGGDLVDGKPVSRGLSYVIRRSEQIKSADVITYDNDGNIIPISQRFNPENEDIRYSLRNDVYDSPRSILARALASEAKTPVDRDAIKRYQDKVGELNRADIRLQGIRAQIAELSVDEKANRKQLSELRNEERSLQRKVDYYDRKLLGLESTAMMKRIVEEERQKAVATVTDFKAAQKARLEEQMKENRAVRDELTGRTKDVAIMEQEFIRLVKEFDKEKVKGQKLSDKLKQAAVQKENADIWEQEFQRLLREYEASGRKIERLEQTISRQRATAKARVEGRRNTEMRHKIQRKADELNRLLVHGTKHRNIPEFLQPAVADIMKAINMEVRDGEQRRRTYEQTLARYDQQIAAETDPAKVTELIEKRNAYAAKGDQFANKMEGLKKAYDQIREGKVPNMELDEGLSDALNTLFEKVGNTPLGQMTAAQLEAVNDVLNITMATVRNANKLLAEERSAGVEENSKAVMREVRSIGGETKKKPAALNKIERFGWNNLKPVQAFEVIGSEKLTGLFKNLRKGEDTLGNDLAEGKAFFQNQWKKHGADKWNMEKKWKFTSTSGRSFELDLEQIMSLYALSKRDQARSHLRVGGFSFDNQDQTEEKVKIGPVNLKVKMEYTDASAYNLSDEILGEIIGKLTPQQRSFVDEMQGYLSKDMAAKGNEISLKKYGIRLFKESNYFPLRVADQYTAKAREQQPGDRKLKDSGFTKEVTPEAKNPVVLSAFTKVWAEHVDEMSLYHSFVLPLDDLNRVLNYHDQFMEEESSQSVVEAIRNAYGKGATDYIDKLIKDVNGGARTDSVASTLNSMMSKAKKAQTMASLSVAIQQPSAIMRSMAMIDPKYFVGPKVTEKTHDRTWDEMKKYSGICHIKEMGGFDTNVGQSAVDYLTDTASYDGFGDKFKALFTDEKFRDDALGRLPALMDEITWGAIWNAVKREQADLHPAMNTNSRAFMKKVSERFEDVIVHTQVYDSVFSRSGLMRSKDTGMKMATAFMAEPTTTANMLALSILNAKRGGKVDRAQLVRTTSAIVGSLIANSFLVAIAYALRDDDEDKRLGEKWLENFRENFFEGLNPMGYIPVVRDIQSMMRGFDVERSDMALYGDLINAIRGLGDDKVSALDKVEAVVGSVGNLLGVPLKNMIRDGKGVFNTIRIALQKDDPATKTGRYMALTGKDLNDGEQLLLAIQRGDDAHIQRVAGRFENQQKAESALQSAIKQQYISGKVTAEDAAELLIDNFDDRDENDVYWILDQWDYAKDNGSAEGYTKYGRLREAIANGEGIEAEIDRYMEHGAEASDIRSEISRTYRKQYLEAGEEERTQIREKIMPAYLYTGMDEADVLDKFNDWDFEAQYGMTYSQYKAEYREGTVTEAQMREAMDSYGLMNYEIEENIRDLNDEIAFVKKYGMSMSEMYDAYDDGDVSRNEMIAALKFTGKKESDAKQAITQRDIRNRIGIEYAELDDAYKHNDISRKTLYDAMIENGATRQEADEAIIGYDWLKKNVKKHPDLTISDGKKFAVRIGENAKDSTLEDYGVTIEAYKDYKDRIGDCKGVDADGDGETDSGTLRDSIFRMIDSLPISDEAKDGLALQKYSMNSIRKNAPWH